jgi:thioredoxin reductase (NADPH)
MTARARLLLAGYVALALIAFFIVPRGSYQPGKVLAAHAGFATQCAACHRPWRGADNSGCIACHGDFSQNNPHGGYDVTDTTDGLIAGRHLVVFKDNDLGCLSCHSEHHGRQVDVRVQAAFSCAWCHKHPTIQAVAKHGGPTLSRHESANQMFQQPFNHNQHSLLMGLQAETFPKGFDCATCHLVTPVAPGAPDKMTIAWAACAPCHANPQVSDLGLPASVGTSPVTLPYSGVVRTLHVNAVFDHSKGHLRTPCVQCHLKVAQSAKPDDANSLLISQCFTCHAHQEETPGALQRSASERESQGPGFPGLEGLAMAQVSNPRVVACGQCHWFHSHGPVPTLDFTKPALKEPPGGRGRIVLVAYVPQLRHRAGSAIPAVGLERTELSPWGIGAIGFILVGLCAVAYTRFLPAAEEHSAAVMESAPQRIIKTPVLDDTYETSIRGLYIIGEMGGTASINLAMRSGRQVIESIAETLKHSQRPPEPGLYDVLIVGCGPAGLGATATAKGRGLNYVTLERMTPASTLRTYPRAKFVQATPIDIVEYGSFFLEGDTTREDLIREWEKIIAQAELVIQDREEVVAIEPGAGTFTVRTAQQHEFKSRCVVLAIGLRGHPRRLNVPGEVAGRVHYQLIEPDDFRNQRILVLGGGNAGAEVTQALAAPHLGNKVSYSYRDAVLTKVTHENAEKIIALKTSGAITVYPSTEIKEIKAGAVALEMVKGHVRNPEGAGAAPIELDNDLVFAMLGAELPTRFLESLGIRMEIKHR